jgi:hypothetical protein
MVTVRLLSLERVIACGVVLVVSASCGLDRGGTEAPYDGGGGSSGSTVSASSSGGSGGSGGGSGGSSSSGAPGDDGTSADGSVAGDDGSTTGTIDGGAPEDSGSTHVADAAPEAGVDPCVTLGPCCATLMVVSAMSYSSCEEGAHSGSASLCQYLLGEFQGLGICK